MAQDSDKPTAADKGKGKAVEDAKNEKPAANGKKEDEKIVDGERSLWDMRPSAREPASGDHG